MTDEAPTKRPVGRPSAYRPEYCDMVIECGKAGKSRTWIATEIGVNRSTLYEWEVAHTEFSDALARAKDFEQRWWEDAGQVGLRHQGFGQSVWSRNMAARFPKEWREKTALVGGDQGDEPIKQEINLAADDFTRRIVGLATRGDKEGGDGAPE